MFYLSFLYLLITTFNLLYLINAALQNTISNYKLSINSIIVIHIDGTPAAVNILKLLSIFYSSLCACIASKDYNNWQCSSGEAMLMIIWSHFF